ncbi:MBOAT family protein [Yangia mangrovi]|uniref:Probable alginate O-acetylase AlgI n=1 Tax=Alloyangia mangrovi TaxID=1779329 RepID=A0ABT2KP61_9RHOB|nr:MBOAT family protein [Alloyangia mangrovi]MCT4372639.1 MBOAT family protein [Alloyangia mangrovi]
MVFSSETFLFLFLPLFLVAYFAVPWRFKSLVILAGSYLFYAWWRLDFLGLLFATTLFAYLVGQRIARHRDTARGRLWLAVGMIGCLGVLGVFKYLNFFIDSFATLLGTDAAGVGVHWRLILPIGISFYIFQALSYLIDVWRGDARADAKFVDFAAFIALFPQLIAGPILRYKDLEDQFRSRTHSLDLFSEGMARFLVGLGKKVLLADAVAPLADLAFNGSGEVGLLLAWAGAGAYMLQLYFDFSGYSDMAIGLGKMMGFHFPENFLFPYISRSITEFWRRWHISLSTWLRDYLYISLGGNRLGRARTYANLMAVMVLGGLWHGANWTFVLWGLWHGCLLALERATGHDRRAAGLVWSLPLTLLLVLLGWVMFRAANVGQGFEIYAAMLGANGLWGDPALWHALTRESLALTGIAALVAWMEPRLAERREGQAALGGQPLQPGGGMRVIGGVAAQALTATLLLGLGVLTVLKLSEQSFSPFLYFQF